MSDAEAYAALAVVRVRLPTGTEVQGKPLGWRKAIEYMELLAKYDANFSAPLSTRESADVLAGRTIVKVAEEFPDVVDLQPRAALDALSFSELIGLVRTFCIHQRGPSTLVETTPPTPSLDGPST